jgi:hypothetical protein
MLKLSYYFDNFSAYERTIKKMNTFYLFIAHSDIDEYIRKLKFLSKSLHPFSSYEILSVNINPAIKKLSEYLKFTIGVSSSHDLSKNSIVIEISAKLLIY